MFDVEKRCSKRPHNARAIAGGNRGESRVAWALKKRRCPLFLALAPRRHLHFDPSQMTATVTFTAASHSCRRRNTLRHSPHCL
jgi:hypothetical protein